MPLNRLLPRVRTRVSNFLNARGGPGPFGPYTEEVALGDRLLDLARLGMSEPGPIDPPGTVVGAALLRVQGLDETVADLLPTPAQKAGLEGASGGALAALADLPWDAIVDASGAGGTHTSISQAFIDGAVNVLVRDGVYVETADIVIPQNGRLEGETAGGVRIVLGAFQVRADGSGRQITTGTISYVTGSATVTGTGTTFTSLQAGDFINLGGVYHEILSVETDTSLTLRYTFRGAAPAAPIAFIGQSMIAGPSMESLVLIGSTGDAIDFRQVIHATISRVLLVGCAGPNGAVRARDCSGMPLTGVLVEEGTGLGFRINRCTGTSLLACVAKNCASHGFSVRNTSRAIILDTCLAVQNGGTGFRVGADGTSSEITLADCQALQNNGIGFDLLAGCFRIILDTCLACTSGSHGISVASIDNTLSDCVVKANSGKGVVFSGAAPRTAIASCTLASNVGTGIDCGASSGISISACVLAVNGGGGIIVGPDGLVSTCQVVANTGIGISLPSTADDAIVKGCRVKGSSGVGISIAGGCVDAIVANNNAKGNTGTSIVNSGTGTIIDNNKT